MLSKTVIPSLRYRHFLAGCALAFCSGLQAEVQEVSGEFFYGPNTSEKQACEPAEQRAKQEALRQVLGDCISSQTHRHPFESIALPGEFQRYQRFCS